MDLRCTTVVKEGLGSLAGGYDHPIDKATWLYEWGIYDAAYDYRMGKRLGRSGLQPTLHESEATDHVRP